MCSFWSQNDSLSGPVCLSVCLSICPRFINEADVSPKNKQTKLLQFKNKQFLFIYSYPLSNRGAMAKANGAEVPEKHDDVVLIQLVLTQLAKCSPFPQLMVSQASWP